MNKFYLPIVAVLALNVDGHAADDVKLKINGDGTAQSSYSLSEINRITFSGNVMTVDTDDGSTDVSLPDVDCIVFDFTLSANESITADLSDGITIDYADGNINVMGTGIINATVYNLNGIQVTSATGENCVTLNLSTLSKGTYIIKVNNKTIKFIR
ncbi:MAG: T9SS type A sorting domain-containing protein [Muribaculaceae bacterium]|nr:T9SS type A sorting domain-containing protein [Bacteroides sp.]MDE7473354.1 T9SS type A sorting domain-containing protein [Muribaculaceae bacterium]